MRKKKEEKPAVWKIDISKEQIPDTQSKSDAQVIMGRNKEWLYSPYEK